MYVQLTGGAAVQDPISQEHSKEAVRSYPTINSKEEVLQFKELKQVNLWSRFFDHDLF